MENEAFLVSLLSLSSFETRNSGDGACVIDDQGNPTDRFGEYLFGRPVVAYDFRIKVS